MVDFLPFRQAKVAHIGFSINNYHIFLRTTGILLRDESLFNWFLTHGQHGVVKFLQNILLLDQKALECSIVAVRPPEFVQMMILG